MLVVPKGPVVANPDRTAFLHVAVPGWLKNQVVDAAAAAGLSVTGWLVQAVRNQLFFGDSVRPEARAMPTSHEVIADYLAGRRTVAPCGRPFPCEGVGRVECVAGVEFCVVCKVRVG